jgi:hypothetical protein
MGDLHNEDMDVTWWTARVGGEVRPPCTPSFASTLPTAHSALMSMRRLDVSSFTRKVSELSEEGGLISTLPSLACGYRAQGARGEGMFEQQVE